MKKKKVKEAGMKKGVAKAGVAKAAAVKKKPKGKTKLTLSHDDALQVLEALQATAG